MEVKDIGRAEFVRRLPARSDLERFIGEEIEWFSNQRGNVIGTIARGDKSKGWNYVVLKQTQTSEFHVCNAVCNFYNHEAARVDCMFAMVEAGQNRPAQFSQMTAETDRITKPEEGHTLHV